MSEDNLQNLFNNYVKEFQTKLEELEEKYGTSPNDAENCIKYIQKLKLYEEYLNDLQNSGERYIRMINNLKDRLNEQSLDASSDTSHTDERVYADLEFLRRCIDNRVALETKAINSLADLERILYAVLKDNDRLMVENRKLREENDQKMATISMPQVAKQLHYTASGSKSMDLNENATFRFPNAQSNCEDEIAALNLELDAKDKKIDELLLQIDKLNEANASVSSSRNKLSSATSSRSNDDAINRKTSAQNIRPSRSDIRPNQRSSSPDLTDSEKRDNERIKALENGYKELAHILKEKYEQLRAQREKINDLMEKLEQMSKKDDELIELKDESAKLRTRNKHLDVELNELKESRASLQDIQRQAEAFNVEIATLKERENILARKIALQDVHITTLLSERQNLIRMNNEMLESISICQKEICKFKLDV